MKKYILIFLVPFFFGCSDDSKNNSTQTDAGADVSTTDVQVDSGTLNDVGTTPDVSTDLGEEDAGTEQVSLFEPGPHNIGYRSWDFQYDSNDELGRELRLSVWYPTADTEGTAARYYNLLNRTEIFDGATVVDDTFPVVVFSHGNTSFGEQSYFFAEFLTSHGFIVVAPDHTGNTFRGNTATFAEASTFRPQDISAALDEVQNLPTEDPLFGKLTDDIALSGHSFGGYTTLAVSGASFNTAGVDFACQNGQLPVDFCMFYENSGKEQFEAGFLDERIKAAIPMAPVGAAFFGPGVADIKIPTLMITAGQDRTLPNASEGDPIWAQFSAPATRIDILKGGHFTFSNICELAGNMPNFANDGCSDEFIPSAEAFVIINAFSLAFLKKNLLGETTYDAFLSASGEFSLDIILSEK